MLGANPECITNCPLVKFCYAKILEDSEIIAQKEQILERIRSAPRVSRITDPARRGKAGNTLQALPPDTSDIEATIDGLSSEIALYTDIGDEAPKHCDGVVIGAQVGKRTLECQTDTPIPANIPLEYLVETQTIIPPPNTSSPS
jgi:hypothetical protein